MLKFKPTDLVVLTKDVSSYGLQRGDLGTVVDAYRPLKERVEIWRKAAQELA